MQNFRHFEPNDSMTQGDQGNQILILFLIYKTRDLIFQTKPKSEIDLVFLFYSLIKFLLNFLRPESNLSLNFTTGLQKTSVLKK